MVANRNAVSIAARIGTQLERENAYDVGIALGIILGGFIILLERTDDGISNGIDAIANDAKDVAKKLRNMRQ